MSSRKRDFNPIHNPSIILPGADRIEDFSSIPRELVEKEANIWSYSKFKIFKDCHVKFGKDYLRKIKVPRDTTPFLQGKVVHKLVEDTRKAVLEGDISEPLQHAAANLPDYFKSAAIKPGISISEAEYIKGVRECGEMTENYLRMLEVEGLLDADVDCEHWFGSWRKPLRLKSGIGLTGAIDWRKKRDELIIYDAKSSRTKKWLDLDQLKIYALATRQELGIDVRKVKFLMIRWNKVLEFVLTSEDIDNIERDLLRARDTVLAQNLLALPNSILCDDCWHQKGCKSYVGWLLNDSLEASF